MYLLLKKNKLMHMKNKYVKRRFFTVKFLHQI